ncbi:MAG: MBL fold metallo-hydrolase, partial [Oscillospiraceae bacterium]|nr:MBL fold metallo-hydrolase [Oscillospiraceae bacterium]
MPQELAPNLFRIDVPLPGNPLKNLNAYLIRGSRSLLIDTGFRRAECRDALIGALDSLGVALADTDIFLTHMHSDHSGLAAEIAVPGTRIFISEIDLQSLPGKCCKYSWDSSDDYFAANGFPRWELDNITQTN